MTTGDPVGGPVRSRVCSSDPDSDPWATEIGDVPRITFDWFGVDHGLPHLDNSGEGYLYFGPPVLLHDPMFLGRSSGLLGEI